MTRLFDDTTMKVIEFALVGVSKRQQTTAHNIANVNTPGFRASRVAFEDQLTEALSSRSNIQDVSIRTIRANTPINTRGNDVALEQESKDLIESGIQYEALVNALNFKLGTIRIAIGRS